MGNQEVNIVKACNFFICWKNLNNLHIGLYYNTFTIEICWIRAQLARWFFFLRLVYVTSAFYAFFKTPSGVYNSTKNKKFSLAQSPFSLKVKIGRQLLMVVISNGAIVKEKFTFRHLLLLENNPFDGCTTGWLIQA